MTEYPKIEVKREPTPEDGDPEPHRLVLGGGPRLWFLVSDAEADQWEALAKFTKPLPVGVRWAMVAEGEDIPEGWEARSGRMWGRFSAKGGVGGRIYEVRPPQEPTTERIWGPNACGRKTPEGHPITVVMRHGESPYFDTTVIDMDGVVEADPDGHVEVLVEQAQ